MTTAPPPMHAVNLALDKGHEFTEETMMKMLADRNQHFPACPINNRFGWEEALMTCFGNHSVADRQRLI